MSEDIEFLLAGHLDKYPDVEILQQIQDRARDYGLYGIHDAKKVAEFLDDHHVSRQLDRLGAYFSHESIGHVIQGRTLHQNPGVNLACIRALFGSLADFVKALDATAVKQKQPHPEHAYYIDIAGPDEARLNAMQIVLEHVVERRNFVRQVDVANRVLDEFAYFILHREPWLLERVREGWESNGRGFAAMGISDRGKADELMERLNELAKDPFHPRRSPTLLLRGIMPRNTFAAHSEELPILSKTLNDACEEPVDFYRRIYLAMVLVYPTLLRPGMPRSAKYIGGLTEPRLRGLLTDLGVKIINGHVKSI